MLQNVLKGIKMNRLTRHQNDIMKMKQVNGLNPCLNLSLETRATGPYVHKKMSSTQLVLISVYRVCNYQ